MTDEERKAFSILNDRIDKLEERHRNVVINLWIVLLPLIMAFAFVVFAVDYSFDAIQERLDAPTTQRTTP